MLREYNRICKSKYLLKTQLYNRCCAAVKKISCFLWNSILTCFCDLNILLSHLSVLLKHLERWAIPVLKVLTLIINHGIPAIQHLYFLIPRSTLSLTKVILYNQLSVLLNRPVLICFRQHSIGLIFKCSVVNGKLVGLWSCLWLWFTIVL